MSGKAFFMLRGVDSALWTAAREDARSQGITITELIEVLLSDYMNSDEEEEIQTQARRAWKDKG